MQHRQHQSGQQEVRENVIQSAVAPPAPRSEPDPWHQAAMRRHHTAPETPQGAIEGFRDDIHSFRARLERPHPQSNNVFMTAARPSIDAMAMQQAALYQPEAQYIPRQRPMQGLLEPFIENAFQSAGKTHMPANAPPEVQGHIRDFLSPPRAHIPSSPMPGSPLQPMRPATRPPIPGSAPDP